MSRDVTEPQRLSFDVDARLDASRLGINRFCLIADLYERGRAFRCRSTLLLEFIALFYPTQIL